jgi:two-component system, OmpR family, sensor kinase
MLETVRARLTAWYVSVLAVVLIAFSLGVYAFLAQALHARVDEGLRSVLEIAATSLTHDAAEGQDPADAARSTVAELSNRLQRLAIHDAGGRLLARSGDEPEDLHLPGDLRDARVRLYTVPEDPGDDDFYRVAVWRARIPPAGATYVIAAAQSLEPIEHELHSVRRIMLRAVPLALLAAGLGGWFLARKSLAPVVAMAEQARRMGAADVAGTLPVANPRDELGRLAAAFNELLTRLAAAFTRQRQFMADASHELRTPLAALRTAASVALRPPRREEAEYRQALEVVADQSRRLTRIVEDMFTLARADAGDQPLRSGRLYLDELVSDTARAAEVLARPRGITIAVAAAPEAPFEGDEDLLRRMVQNLLDNAIRFSPPASAVEVALSAPPGEYHITVSDQGPGIAPEHQPQLFERFYRADAARSRGQERAATGSGAGLGLAIARWIAEAHRGTLRLARSGKDGATFEIVLPQP